MEVVVSVVTLAVLLFGWLTWWVHSNYWQQKGIKVAKPCPFPLGNSLQFNGDFLFGRKHINDLALEQYREMKDEKLYGTFMAYIPHLVVKDPELIKHILVKDFPHFVDRSNKYARQFLEGLKNRSDKIWVEQLTSATGETWKNLR